MSSKFKERPYLTGVRTVVMSYLIYSILDKVVVSQAVPRGFHFKKSF